MAMRARADTISHSGRLTNEHEQLTASQVFKDRLRRGLGRDNDSTVWYKCIDDEIWVVGSPSMLSLHFPIIRAQSKRGQLSQPPLPASFGSWSGRGKNYKRRGIG